MQAIIRARVSTKEQEEGHSIAAQRQRLVDYCAASGYSAAAFCWAKIRPSSKNCVRLTLPKWHSRERLEKIVADLARLVWRKQNFATFSLAERARTYWFELRAANSMRNFRTPTIHL
jgi:hypothetical protein